MSRQERNRRRTREDAIASIRAEMEHAEAHRLRTLRLAIGLAALTLLAAAVLALSMVGSGV